MSTRLQVVLDDTELDEIRQAATAEGTTVSEWVRRALREARRARATPGVKERLAILAQAMQYRFPAGPIEEMLGEIELGYHSE